MTKNCTCRITAVVAVCLLALTMAACGKAPPPAEGVAAAEEALGVSSSPPWCHGYPGDPAYTYSSTAAFSLWNIWNAGDPSDGWAIENSPGVPIVENFDGYADGADITDLMPDVRVTSGLVTARWINGGQYKRAFIDVPTAQGEQFRAIFRARDANGKWRHFGKMTTEARVIVTGIDEAQTNPHVALMARYNTSYDTYYAALRFEKMPDDLTGTQRRLYAYVQRKLCGKYVQFGGGASTSKKYLDRDHLGNPLPVPSPNFVDGTPQTFTLRFTYDPASVGRELAFYINWLGQTAFNTEYGWNRPVAEFDAASLGVAQYSPQPTAPGTLEPGVGGIRSDDSTFYLDDFKLY